jgi:hypothetical protein
MLSVVNTVWQSTPGAQAGAVRPVAETLRLVALW